MKAKLFAFAVALFSAAIIGLVQLPSEATQPGQVGGAPRCTVKAVGARDSAFQVAQHTGKIRFHVTGKSNCKVRVSANSFYAPTMNGKPYSKQSLYKRVTNVYKRGTYSLSVALPVHSTKAKGCYYQADLTYNLQSGAFNSLPVLAYDHGKLDCSKPKPPVATCDNLAVTRLSRTSFRFNASASAKHGAKIKSYQYQVNGKTIYSGSATSVKYTQPQAGAYTAKLSVKTSVGTKTSAKCQKQLTVTNEKKPGVSIEKTVDGKKQETVALNQTYHYELTVTNTGNTALKNVAVSDPAPKGVQFVGANLGMITDNKWSYVIPSLGIGESKSFTITAKVTEEIAGNTRNTACVDAPQVPGNPDDCDHADVNVPPKQPGKVVVCNPSTGEIISVDEDQEDNYAPTNSEECQPAPTPSNLPVTGPVETILKMIGAGSLTGAATYYIASRRNA